MWSKDNDVVRDAVLTTPNAYMQLVGIVQALAVGLLLQQGAFFNLLEAGRVDVRSVEFWLAFSQTTTTFQLIVLTWHVNVQTITVFQRVFGLADSYIPFSFISRSTSSPSIPRRKNSGNGRFRSPSSCSRR